MNQRLSRYARCFTLLGGLLLFWSAMQSDGGAPLALVIPAVCISLLLLLAGRGLRFLGSPSGRAFRRQRRTSPPEVSPLPAQIRPFPKAG